MPRLDAVGAGGAMGRRGEDAERALEDLGLHGAVGDLLAVEARAGRVARGRREACARAPWGRAARKKKDAGWHGRRRT